MMPIPKAYKIGLPIGIALWALIIWSVSAAFAQSGGNTTRPTWFDGAIQYYVSTAHPLPITGSFSATTTGFPTIQSTGTPISVTTGGVTGTLPTGAVVVASNVGATNGAYCKLGASATTSDQLIPPNSWFAFTVGANTQLTCITSTSTTTVNTVGGSGLPTGSGGGGGGSGGGAITAAINSYAAGALSAGSVASGAMVDLGAQADAVCGSSTGSCSLIALTKFLNNAALAPLPITDQVGGGTTPMVGDPCKTTAKTTLPITLATAAVKVIATGVSAKKIYVCQIHINNNAADTIAVFEATTATACVTSPVAVVGAGTTVGTAGTGYNFPATAGISLGNGDAQVLVTTVNNNDLCIAQSAATQLTGSITYVTR